MGVLTTICDELNIDKFVYPSVDRCQLEQEQGCDDTHLCCYFRCLELI